MSAPEFSRPVDVRHCAGREFSLVASEAERAALSSRFELVRIDRLEAHVSLDADGAVIGAKGSFSADLVQSCAVSAEDLPASVNEEIDLRFVPAARDGDRSEELELDAGDCDEIEYSGTTFDLGEAVAQSLALAIDPFATGPQAASARAIFESQKDSPFAALKGLGTSQKGSDKG